MRSLSYLCGSDTFSATEMIKEKGIEAFAKYMAKNNLQWIRKQE
jgi:hypothetical protein